MPPFLVKMIAGSIFKAIRRKIEWKRMENYVNKPNELDKQMKQANKTIGKYGKYIEELEKDVAILKKNSHPRSDWICLECGCKAKKKETPRRRRRRKKLKKEK